MHSKEALPYSPIPRPLRSLRFFFPMQASEKHQPRYPLPSAPDPQDAQLGMNPRSAVGFPAIPVDVLYTFGEPMRRPSLSPRRPGAPSVIAALGDPQDPAEGADAVVGLLRFNKAIDHPRGRRYSCRAKKAAVGSTGRSDTVGFSVSSESEVWTWLDWVVQGCPRRVRRSCRRGGRLGSPSATSPAPSRSLPAPFTGCSRPPVGSLRPSDAGQGGRSPRDERGEISRGLAAEESMRAIAARVGRAASTVSREVDRNGGRGSYRALRADERAWERARRPKRSCSPKTTRCASWWERS
jgi:hypothetical protein